MSTTTEAPDTTTAAKPKLKTSAMIASFADPGQKTSSAPFGHALVKAAQENDKIVGLTADLGKYTDMHIFAKAFPERFFQMGMAEQLLFGAAAGLAETGLVPFASTYSVFAARRAYDFLCLDAAEPNLNVNIVGGLPGLTTGYGPSHRCSNDRGTKDRRTQAENVRHDCVVRGPGPENSIGAVRARPGEGGPGER